MYIAHYALPFAARRAAPKVPLAILFLASNWADLLWVALVGLGAERAAIQPGITAASAFDMQHNPYSHGLAATLIWAALFGGLWALVRKDRRGGWTIAAMVLGHWVLDLLSHRPDLPLLLDGPRVGLGLWHHRAASLLVEGGLFAVCMALYLRDTKARAWWAHAAFWVLVAWCGLTYLPGALGAGPEAPVAAGAVAPLLLPVLPITALVLLLVVAIDRGRPLAR